MQSAAFAHGAGRLPTAIVPAPAPVVCCTRLVASAQQGVCSEQCSTSGRSLAPELSFAGSSRFAPLALLQRARVSVVACAARGRKKQQPEDVEAITDLEVEQPAPAKKTRRRKASTAADDSPLSVDEPAADAGWLAAPEPEPEAILEPEAPAPAKPKRTRRAAAAKAVVEEVDEPAEDSLSEAAWFGSEEEPAPVAAEKPASKRGRKKKAAETPVADDAAEAEPAPAPVVPKYDLSAELAKLQAARQPAAVATADGAEDQLQLQTPAEEDGKPKMFGAPITVEEYRRWFVLTGEEETAELPPEWPKPKTIGEEMELAWRFTHEAQFKRDFNYEDYDNEAFKSHHEQREKCVNIYANVRQIAGIMKEMENLDYAMGEHQTYYSSWARSEVLFRPSIDGFNDYLRQNIHTMTRYNPALEAAEVDDAIDEYLLVPNDQREEVREVTMPSQDEMDAIMDATYLEGIFPGVSLADGTAASSLADDIFDGGDGDEDDLLSKADEEEEGEGEEVEEEVEEEDD